MIIVIGAGPAGLATAYYLQQRKLEYVVLERDEIGNSWRNHYDSLSLHTLKGVSSLPGLPYPESTPDFPTKDDFVAHMEAYVAHFKLNVKTGVAVEHVEYKHHREDGFFFEVTTPDEVLRASHVFVATGIWGAPKSPNYEGMAEFGGEILHANGYQSAESFKNKRVLVVGAGNTAADIAVELAEAGIETGVAMRSGTTFVPYPKSVASMKAAAWFFRNAPPAIGNRVLASARPDFSDLGIRPNPKPPIRAYPVVGFKLPDAIRNGSVTLYKDVERLGHKRVCFVDGVEAEFDVIINATGYRPNLDFISEKEITFYENGWPNVCAHYRSRKNPRLYCVGFSYPATSGWIQDMRRTTKIAVGAVGKWES